MTGLLLASLIAGLVGSTHCAGMCGGISAALGAGGGAGRVVLHNTGRIASYALAGAVAGALGLALGGFVDTAVWVPVLRGATAAVLILLGLQIAFGWHLLAPVERIGMRLWQRVAPFAGGLMRRRGPLAALGLGALWGWLPCGLVYGMLAVASTSGGALPGAGVMIAFGLGTAPAMVGLGALSGRLAVSLRRPAWRRFAGATVIALGLWTALAVLPMPGGHTMGQPADGITSHTGA